MNIPPTLVAGDSADWLDDPVRLDDGRLATSSSWALKYAIRGASRLDVTATASGTSWACAITAAQSAALTAGIYVWAAQISLGLERFTIGNGQLVLTPDLSAVTSAYDGRTTARKALDDCEAAMATFNATGGKVKRYDIAGRSMEFQSIADLMTLHSFWRTKVDAEETTAKLANGLGNPRNLYVRFNRT